MPTVCYAGEKKLPDNDQAGHIHKGQLQLILDLCALLLLLTSPTEICSWSTPSLNMCGRLS